MLQGACASNHVHVTEFLLERGAWPGDSYESSVYSTAIGNNSIACVELLLSKGVDFSFNLQETDDSV